MSADRLVRAGSLLFALASLSRCAEQEPRSYHWTALGVTTESGTVYGLAIAPDGTPYAHAEKGVFRFDGEKFVPAEPAFPSIDSPIRFGPDGTIYNHQWRLRPSAKAWEPMSGAEEWLDTTSTPVPTSDGDLYAFSHARPLRIGYLAAGSSTWKAIADLGNVSGAGYPDATGALWLQTDDTLWVARKGELKLHVRSVGVMGVGSDGTQYYGNMNYTHDYGEVVARKVNGEELLVTHGLSCTQSGAEPCPVNDITPHASFIHSWRLAPSGSIYEMWARENREIATRTVMRLRPGAHSWEPLKSTWEDQGKGIDGLGELYVDANDRIYVVSHSQIGLIGNGGWVNIVSSAIHRLDPD